LDFAGRQLVATFSQQPSAPKERQLAYSVANVLPGSVATNQGVVGKYARA